MHHFLDGILKISERSVEPARSVVREIYGRQEAKVLPLDGTESEELVPDRSLVMYRFCLRLVCCATSSSSDRALLLRYAGCDRFP
jgi:hypothetical protein